MYRKGIVEPVLFRDTIDETQLETEANYWIYRRGKGVEIRSDTSTNDLPPAFQELDGRYEKNPLRVFEVRNARLVGKEAIGFTDSNDPILNTVRGDHKKLGNAIRNATVKEKTRFLLPSSPNTKFSDVFYMVPEHNSYYAWVTEFLPKLHGLQRYVKETGRRPTILLRSGAAEFMSESIEFFGFNDFEIVEWDTTSAAVDRLILTDHAGPNKRGSYRPHPAAWNWINERARELAPESSRNNRLYVSRHDVMRRHAKNEDEVVNTLEQRGFERVKPGDMKFEEQVSTFLNADIVVGIHGAGLGNILFADDPALLEILPPHKKAYPAYYCLTQTLGFKYQYLPAGGNEDKGINVPVNALNRRVDTMLNY